MPFYRELHLAGLFQMDEAVVSQVYLEFIGRRQVVNLAQHSPLRIEGEIGQSMELGSLLTIQGRLGMVFK